MRSAPTSEILEAGNSLGGLGDASCEMKSLVAVAVTSTLGTPHRQNSKKHSDWKLISNANCFTSNASLGKNILLALDVWRFAFRFS
jgi:hypothetical protein